MSAGAPQQGTAAAAVRTPIPTGTAKDLMKPVDGADAGAGGADPAASAAATTAAAAVTSNGNDAAATAATAAAGEVIADADGAAGSPKAAAAQAAATADAGTGSADVAAAGGAGGGAGATPASSTPASPAGSMGDWEPRWDEFNKCTVYVNRKTKEASHTLPHVDGEEGGVGLCAGTATATSARVSHSCL